MAIDFLRTEVDMASVFLSLALNADDPEKRLRNARNARHGYETLVYFASQFALSADERDEVEMGISDLRNQLIFLGEEL